MDERFPKLIAGTASVGRSLFKRSIPVKEPFCRHRKDSLGVSDSP